MKKRLHDKKAGIVILCTLLIISLADIILRATMFRDILYTTANYGEPLITAVFSALLLIFAFTGKDRIVYILCGAWIAFFVINQLYGIPNMIATLTYCIKTPDIFGIISAIAHMLTIICIIAIGVLLVEYMNDGTIYNKAFNIICVITVAIQIFLLINNLHSAIHYDNTPVILAAAHELARLVMIFLFAFFAYDSAKHQLKKTDFSK